MSKIRTLFPEADSSVATELIPKLKKALILCELLQSSSSNRSGKVDETILFLPDFPELSYKGRVIQIDNDFGHFADRIRHSKTSNKLQLLEKV